MTRLFVVEDEAIVREDVVRTLKRLGYEVVGSAQGGVEALLAIENLQPALVLMDIRLSGRMDGIQTTAAIRKRWSIPVIYLTAHSDEATLSRAKETGPHGYLLKPFNERDLRTAIEVALKKHELEERLEKRERWFSTTLDSAGDAIIATDVQDRITFMNAVAESLTGWKRDEALQRPLSEVFKLVGRDAPLGARDGFRAELPSSGAVLDRGGQRREVDDSESPIVDAQGQVLGNVVVFRDVTQKRRLERRLQLAERVASVSSMAANMAHEINSPLAATLANVDFAAHRLREAREAAQLSATETQELLRELADTLEDARAAGARVRRVVLDLKKFSRVDEPAREPLDLPNVVDAALARVDAGLRGAVRISLNLGTTPLVMASEGRLLQIVENLLTNACEAVTDVPRPGQIDISTRIDDAGRAVLEIRDNGRGIEPSTLPRVFEPFFTTKQVGDGLGLGLSIAQSGASALGGELAVESRLGSGTTFRLTLPAAAATPTKAVAPLRAAARRARVLLIDDEPLVGKTLERLLARSHDVVYESRGQAALARIEAGESFDVILCDLTMPQVTGIDVFERIQAVAPALVKRVVFLTGGVVSPQGEAFLETCTNVVIQKPFSMDRVLAVVASYVQ